MATAWDYIRRAIGDVDAVNHDTMDKVLRILGGAGDRPLTSSERAVIMREVDAILNFQYGLSPEAAERSTLFRTILRNTDAAAEGPIRSFFEGLERDARRRDPSGRLWSQIEGAMRDGGWGGKDRMAEYYRALTGPHSQKMRVLRSGYLDPQRRWVPRDKWTTKRGYRLSDRVWKSGRGYRGWINRSIRDGMKRGEGPITIAKSLEQYLNPELAGVRYTADGRVLRRAGGSQGGQATYASRRLAITEVKHMHHEATRESARMLPEEVQPGIEWLLSSRHPEWDVCLIAGTMVATSDGDKAIEDIVIGDMVLTHAGRYMPVTRLYRREVDPEKCVDLQVQGEQGQLHRATMTRNHPVLTGAGWVQAGDLQTGSNVAVYPSTLSTSQNQLTHGTDYRASQGFAESVRGGDLETGDAERCGASRPQGYHKEDICCRDCQHTSSEQTCACGTFRCWQCLHASSGFLGHSDLSTFSSATPQASSTCPVCACHSLDCPRHLEGGILENSIFDWEIGCFETQFHMLGTFSLASHDGQGSSHSSRTYGHSRASAVLSQTSIHTRDMSGEHASSLPPLDTPLSRTDALHSELETLAPSSRRHDSPSVAEWSLHTAHISSSYIAPCVPTGLVPVYNIEVDQDHSYTANGIVVHNCDIYASQDLYGMGKGVYPVDQVPEVPHPGCLCSLTQWIPDHIDLVDAIAKKYGI